MVDLEFLEELSRAAVKTDDLHDGFVHAATPDVVLELVSHIRYLKRELTATDAENRHLANNLDVQRTGRATAEATVANVRNLAESLKQSDSRAWESGIGDIILLILGGGE